MPISAQSFIDCAAGRAGGGLQQALLTLAVVPAVYSLIKNGLTGIHARGGVRKLLRLRQAAD